VRAVVEQGYNRGAVFELGPRSVLGRGEDCDVQLFDDGISRQHAELVSAEEGWQVVDLGSRNGTRLNGVPIERANLQPGDRIGVGGVRLLLLPSPGAEASGAPHDRATQELDLSLALPGASDHTPGFLGESPLVKNLLARVAKAAPSEATCLVAGESGTGKELVARALHDLSPRRRGPFVVLNCAALPAELVESELFGHERGAFTGAVARKIGLAEAAAGGTLFLDELGELPPPAQAKLLRFLENKELVRVGSTTPRRVDVRVVAATHRDLDAMVEAGTFREDLLYRLRVVELSVPPLRERGADVSLLAAAFLALFAPTSRFSPAAREAIAAFSWPGNVRELRNAIEAATIFAEGDQVRVSDLPARVRPTSSAPDADPPSAPLTLEDAERRAILAALEHTSGHRTRTAKLLGIDRKTLYTKLKELGL
jgi:two-component system response regulator HydG